MEKTPRDEQLVLFEDDRPRPVKSQHQRLIDRELTPEEYVADLKVRADEMIAREEEHRRRNRKAQQGPGIGKRLLNLVRAA